MKPKKEQELNLEIKGIAFGGQGISDHEGFKIFVPDTCPGDFVKVQVRKVKKNYAEAKSLELIKASPIRVKAKCAHFETCGGCKFQFLDYAEELKIKNQQVKDALERIGGISSALMKDILACENEWFYRNKMELSFGPSETDSVRLGFYPPGYHFEVFDLKECYLQSEEMAETVARVRDFANTEKLKHYDSYSDRGFLRTLTIREGKNTGEKMIILNTSAGEFNKEAFIKLFPEGTSIYHIETVQKKGRKTESTVHHISGPPVIRESLKISTGKELSFDILPLSFFQTNTKQAELLYSKVIEMAELSGNELVFDLYCGTGTIGLFCAHSAKKIIGVEINEQAVENAINNAKQNGIENIEYFCGPVESVISTLEEKPNLVIVDPPRNGLGEETVNQVASFGAEKIIYVSCNPSTLARDLKEFAKLGYETKSVQVVDMFPKTAHVESISLLSATQQVAQAQ